MIQVQTWYKYKHDIIKDRIQIQQRNRALILLYNVIVPRSNLLAWKLSAKSLTTNEQSYTITYPG